jgi:crotonobetainyl-CoA:carnitine CoA-transferase CaiB-like acyl-CoA transferase
MLPLAAVRVVAVEQYGAGPFGTMFLADLGAEVIKIENPSDGGDISRDVGPYFFEDRDSYFFHALNRNKKSLTLDLSKAGSKEVFHDLVRSADAVCSNLRGDVPQKLGLTYQDLNTVNAAIVCAHLSAYGREGPRADWPGYDYLMQAEAGYLSLTGEPGSPPARFGLSVVDFMTGLGLAYAILAGLTGVRSTGIGQDMDVSCLILPWQTPIISLHGTSMKAVRRNDYLGLHTRLWCLVSFTAPLTDGCSLCATKKNSGRPYAMRLPDRSGKKMPGSVLLKKDWHTGSI